MPAADEIKGVAICAPFLCSTDWPAGIAKIVSIDPSRSI